MLDHPNIKVLLNADYREVEPFIPYREMVYTGPIDEYFRAEGDPYYPVPRPENAELYKRYKALADATPNNHFVGRLATYKYYNMDQVVAQALATFDRMTGVRPSRARPAAHAPATALQPTA